MFGQQKDHQHQHDQHLGQRRQHWRQDGLDPFRHRRFGGDKLHGTGLAILHHALVQLLDHPVHTLRQSSQSAALGAPQSAHLLAHRLRVLRHLRRKIDKLMLEQVAERGHRRERDDGHQGDGRSAPETALDSLDDRTQSEGNHD